MSIEIEIEMTDFSYHEKSRLAEGKFTLSYRARKIQKEFLFFNDFAGGVIVILKDGKEIVKATNVLDLQAIMSSGKEKAYVLMCFCMIFSSHLDDAELDSRIKINKLTFRRSASKDLMTDTVSDDFCETLALICS